MKNGRTSPDRADRTPKLIAPNPWRRGRRRSGVHLNGGTSAAAIDAAQACPEVAGQVTGLFADRASAELACRALGERGYREDAIKLLMSDLTRTRQFSDFESSRHSAAPHQRAYTCPATVSVAVCVDATCAALTHRPQLADVLASSGIPRERIAEYEAALETGAILMHVVTRSADDAQMIESEWRSSNRAQQVHSQDHP